MTPTLPPEFFQPAELRALADRQQQARIRDWLRGAGVAFVVGARGWPLVYRGALAAPALQLPGAARPAHNDSPAHFDFGALHAPRRTPAPRRQP